MSETETIGLKRGNDNRRRSATDVHYIGHRTAVNYLMYVDTVVKRPHRLEVILHSVFELAWYLMQRQEVFEITPLALVQRPSGVHALDDGCHVTEHDGVHEC